MVPASMFRSVAIGVVTENKRMSDPAGSSAVEKRFSRIVMVTPTELNPFLDSEIASNQQEMIFGGTRNDGQQYQGTLTVDVPIETTWLPSGTNRISPPDVRRGERVEIFQASDEDKYYWRLLGLDDNLRKLETVVFAISATADEGKTQLDFDSCYFMEWSSHTQSITVQTSQSNGEVVGFQARFDMKEGTFAVQDTFSNYLRLDSVNTVWTMQNASGTYVKLEKENLYGFAPKVIDFKAGTKIKATVNGSSVDLTAGALVLTAPSIQLKQG